MGGIIGVLVDPDYELTFQTSVDKINVNSISNGNNMTERADLTNMPNVLNVTLPLFVIKLSNLMSDVLNNYSTETLVYYGLVLALVILAVVKFGKRLANGLTIFGMMCMVLTYSILQLLTIAAESWINSRNKSSNLYLKSLPFFTLFKEFWTWLIIDCFYWWVFKVLNYKFNLICQDSSGRVLKLSEAKHLLRKYNKFLSISNHVAYCDWFVILFVAKALNLQDQLDSQFKETMVKFVLKQDLFKLPIIGWMMKASKFVGLARKGLGDLQKLKASMQQFLSDKEGHWLHLFPEGTFQGSNQSTTDLKDPQHYLNVIKKSNEYAEKQGVKLDYTLCPRVAGFSSLLKGAKQARKVGLASQQEQQQVQLEEQKESVKREVAQFKMLDLSIAFYNDVTDLKGTSRANLDNRRRIPNGFDMFIGGEFNAIDVKLELIDDQVVDELIDKSCNDVTTQESLSQQASQEATQNGETDINKFVCNWLLNQWTKKDIWLKQRNETKVVNNDNNDNDSKVVLLTYFVSVLFLIISQGIWLFPLLLILGVKILSIITFIFGFLLGCILMIGVSNEV